MFVLTMHCLQLQVPSVVCPGQSVQVVTGCYLKDDILTKHPLLVYNDNFIEIAVTRLPAQESCYFNMSLFSKDSVFVSGKSLNFSKFFLKN